MDLVGAALPNVMFIVGILAIGLGLGIELKVVSLNKQIDKTGRIGAFVVGIVLIGASVLIYLTPPTTNRSEVTKSNLSESQSVGVVAQPSNSATIATATQAPAAIAPPAQPAPSPTSAPAQVSVPDLHGLSDKDAQERLQDAGLQPRKADRCTGLDQGDAKPKKGRVACQNPPAGQVIASGAAVEYVLAGK